MIGMGFLFTVATIPPVLAFKHVLSLVLSLTASPLLSVGCAFFAGVASLLVVVRWILPRLDSTFEFVFGDMNRGTCPKCKRGKLVDRLWRHRPNWLECDACSALLCVGWAKVATNVYSA